MRAAATEVRPAVLSLTGLYGVTPDMAATQHLLESVDAAIVGGARAIQFRSKHALPDQRHEQAQALAQLCRGRALFIVNDSPALAAAVNADGVHLGEHDGSIAHARARLGPDRLVGVSCYNELARAQHAVAEGADYVAFGSFFPSKVKPDARVADLALLRHGRTLGVPVVAIGGIDAHNAGLLVSAGADAVAVISDLFAHPTPAAITAAAQALVLACLNAQAA